LTAETNPFRLVETLTIRSKQDLYGRADTALQAYIDGTFTFCIGTQDGQCRGSADVNRWSLNFLAVLEHKRKVEYAGTRAIVDVERDAVAGLHDVVAKRVFRPRLTSRTADVEIHDGNIRSVCDPDFAFGLLRSDHSKLECHQTYGQCHYC
jgi:hypothetical protein